MKKRNTEIPLTADSIFYECVRKQKLITEKQKNDILKWLQQFYKETENGDICLQPNGFTAVGILKKKQKHHPDEEPINDVLIADTESSPYGRSITCTFSYVTRDEAKTLAKCINKALRRRRKK
jgi:hypothetical protein